MVTVSVTCRTTGGLCPSETLTWKLNGSEATPSGGEIQVVDAVEVLPNVPCWLGAVCSQAMVRGSPSGSLAVMERVTDSPATGMAGDAVMRADTFGDRFTVR